MESSTFKTDCQSYLAKISNSFSDEIYYAIECFALQLKETWLNGNQVLAHRGITLTLQKEHTNFLKVGIYQCCNSKLIKPANALFTTPKSGPTRESVN